LTGFLEPSLVDAPGYKIDTPPAVRIKLDQNESPWDWPAPIKERILAKVKEAGWNRYPSAFADQLAARVAAYAGVPADSVLLGPGSNYLCSLVLSTFSRKIPARGGKVVVARPSFALYESHCRYDGIPYEVWPLDAGLEYDERLLPALPPHSLVVFASPNNPVGNVLGKNRLEALLQAHPRVLFVADEAYFEYAAEPYTELLARYGNLILIRTFSNTLGAAGVRLGYFLAAPAYLHELKKLRLPYLLNHFSVIAATEILASPESRDYLAQVVKSAVAERERVFQGLSRLQEPGGFRVKNSEANFLLLRWPDTPQALAVYQKLIAAGILVRNVSGSPGLAGCLRITLGDRHENAALLAAFHGLYQAPRA
jgi:histidinol-phosphate aminotransferase